MPEEDGQPPTFQQEEQATARASPGRARGLSRAADLLAPAGAAGEPDERPSTGSVRDRAKTFGSVLPASGTGASTSEAAAGAPSNSNVRNRAKMWPPPAVGGGGGAA